jgi:hypothetical protein
MKYTGKLRHARAELRDARAAYDRADEEELMRFVSNCLVAARSVLLYALEETPREWYDKVVASQNSASGNLMSFIRDLRDEEIHTAPSRPRMLGQFSEVGRARSKLTLLPER